MTELKLAKLPDRVPIKLAVSVMPELHQALVEYAALYAQRYGQQERVEDLVPAMLASFLEGDRTFAKSRKPAPSTP